MSRWWLGWALTLFALGGCKDLPVIEAGTCGNAVVEPGEDCDTFVDPHDVPGGVCRQKGVVGACHFDCRPNSENQRPACPSGMGCAADGICRAPTEDFQAPVRLSTAPASALSSTDFDGDGRSDVISVEQPDQLQQGHFTLHYFDEDSRLAESRLFPRVTTRPVAYKPPHDAKSDLVFSNFRIGMLPGRSDRDWVPATFSSYVVQNSGLRAANLLNQVIGGASAIVAITTLDHETGLFVPSLDTQKLSPRYALPQRPLSELVGEPLVADLIVGVDSPCKELVLAYRGDDFFRVFDMCRFGDPSREPDLVWRDQARVLEVRLPRGKHVDAAPIAADVDGDGDLDVLIGSEGFTYIAEGDGRTLADATGPQLLTVVGATNPLPLPMPLAAGDLSGDGIADFVIPTALVSSRRSPVDGSIAYTGTYDNHQRPWSTARVADLNGNGLLDVVAASVGSPGLSFLNGTGELYPVASRLSTRGPVRMLTTGDFDGDRLHDIAYLEGGLSPDSPDSLSIAFSTPNGFPLPATRVAELSGVEQLGQTRDLGLDSLFVASSQQVHGVRQSSLTLFDGSPERLPFAPYTLVTFAVDGKLDDWGAVALTVGGFVTPGASDVLALGTHDPRQEYTLWLAPHITGEKVPPRLLELEKADGAFPAIRNTPEFRLSVASTAVDLDGDGLDELVALMPSHDTDCALLSYSIDVSDAEHPRARLTGQLLLGEPCPLPELASADLDGDDDKPDALLILAGDPQAGPRKLSVLRSIHSGFSLDNRSFIEGPGGHDIRGFSMFPRAVVPGIHLAFVTDAALYMATTRREQGVFDQVRKLQDFTDARSVVVTDPNGDHINDIVVSDAEGLWLLGARLE